MSDKLILVIILGDGKYYLMGNGEKNVSRFDTVSEGLHYFEDGYNRNHSRGYEASMSACINWLQFQPSIITVNGGVKEVTETLLPNPCNWFSLRSIAGRMEGILMLQDKAKIAFEAGDQPRLINPVV